MGIDHHLPRIYSNFPQIRAVIREAVDLLDRISELSGGRACGAGDLAVASFKGVPRRAFPGPAPSTSYSIGRSDVGRSMRVDAAIGHQKSINFISSSSLARSIDTRCR